MDSDLDVGHVADRAKSNCQCAPDESDPKIARAFLLGLQMGVTLDEKDA